MRHEVAPRGAAAGTTRREFLQTLAVLGLGAACHEAPTGPTEGGARLTLRPARPTRTASLGLQPIGMPDPVRRRDGLLYVPLRYQASTPMPLVVLLHGATGSGSAWFGSYGARAEELGVVMLAPDSRSISWDAIEDERFGPDIAFLQAAIHATFDRCAIDTTRMALVGFSDGASYALSLGMANGDLFRHVVAYSPGMILTDARHGRPRFRVLHGTQDAVLPIDVTSRRLVPRLRSDGYDVTYTEFTGGHEVPQGISDVAMDWLRAGFATR